MNTTPQNTSTSPKNKPRTGERLAIGVKHRPRAFPPHYHTKTHDNLDDNTVTIWVVITPIKPQGGTCPPGAGAPPPPPHPPGGGGGGGVGGVSHKV